MPAVAEVPVPETVLINAVVKNLTALAARAWAKRWMITFTAPTGIGKTTAVDYAARTLSFDHRVLA
jgi:flagellar biosynthesis GTPase FlhF